MKKSPAVAALVAAFLCEAGLYAWASPSASENVSPPPNLPASKPAEVSIGNFTFAPATLEVPAGASVEWVNADDVPHTVLGSEKDSPLRSPALDTDGRYSVVLSKPGTYHYFCSLHPHMTGTIVVK